VVRSDENDDKWFHQWMDTIVSELKEQRKELSLQKDSCAKCREEILGKVSVLDKQIAVIVLKVGAFIAVVTFLSAIFGEYIFKTFLGKLL
jgi:hypothetical protein